MCMSVDRHNRDYSNCTWIIITALTLGYQHLDHSKSWSLTFYLFSMTYLINAESKMTAKDIVRRSWIRQIFKELLMFFFFLLTLNFHSFKFVILNQIFLVKFNVGMLTLDSSSLHDAPCYIIYCTWYRKYINTSNHMMFKGLTG